MTNSRGWGLLLPLTGFLRACASPGSRARFASRCEYRLQGVGQLGRAHAQLRNAMPHQPAQQLFSPRSYIHVHLAAVFRGAFAPEKSPFLHAVYQFHGAVVLDLQPFGQAANGWLLIRRQSAQRQHAHVLLRLEADRPRHLLAVIQIPPDQKSELRKCLIFSSARESAHEYDYIVQRLDRVQKITQTLR
jgi:hypothetical protein